MSDRYYEGIGRRKTSSARVRIYAGKSPSTVNGKPINDYFCAQGASSDILEPFTVVGLDGKYYFTAKVQGGGVAGQQGAVKLGIARALYEMDAELKPTLRKKGLVTRDPRMVERKKYNQKKARRKHQFSKR